ncbi:hypothetical protein MNBD_BACTEROID01-2306 [hydrothermal vent metagenome]|uniref:Uncharacterized protein n=1 Tax=hydrothermal vent metagenome TaxID=652676 RepID=A0A3B0UN24_9ZZZZ
MTVKLQNNPSGGIGGNLLLGVEIPDCFSRYKAYYSK